MGPPASHRQLVPLAVPDLRMYYIDKPSIPESSGLSGLCCTFIYTIHTGWNGPLRDVVHDPVEIVFMFINYVWQSPKGKRWLTH